MSSEFQFITEVWAAVRDVVPANKRADTAVGIMKAFEEYGFTSKELMDVVEEDNDLSDAYHDVFHDDHEDEEAESEDFDE